MSIELVISSNHLILCCSPLLLPSVFPSIRVFSNELFLHIMWTKYWSFSFSISPSNEYSGLISFRIDWFDVLSVQGTLKTVLQHQNSKASILRHSYGWFFFFFSSVTAPFHLEDSRRIQDSKRREWRSAWGGRKRERKRESVHARRRESPRESALAPPFMFFLPPGPALCKSGLARSAVCSAWSFHSGPRTLLWPSLSFSHRHFGPLFPILPT